MKPTDFLRIGRHEVPLGTVLYRVQYTEVRADTIQRGPLKMYGGAALSGRFDLGDRPIAYLAELPQTALYEAVFRKNADMVRLEALVDRELIAVKTARTLLVADLRPFASHFPVLHSSRIHETQELAAAIAKTDLEGLIRQSAQQADRACIVLFDPPADAVSLLWRSPLVADDGSWHDWVRATRECSRLDVKAMR